MKQGYSKVIFVMAAMAIAMPAAAAAQDPQLQETSGFDDPVPEPPAETPPDCLPETTESAAEPEFLMPTTGVAFTLPPEDVPAEVENCAEPTPPPPVRPPAPSLFRMVALPVGLNSSMAKWESARQGAVTDRAGPWDELLTQASTISSGDPVDTVNRWVNWHVRYQLDQRGDDWAAAATTLSRGYGDCEDFALAKMGLLLALGIPPDDMFLVLLRDRRQTDHAVLAVKRNDRFYVLDNRTDVVLPADQVDDYTPIVSYSGPFSWIYGMPAG